MQAVNMYRKDMNLDEAFDHFTPVSTVHLQSCTQKC